MNEFKEWMDSHDVSVSEAGELLGKSNRTIESWRSKKGPPPTNMPMIREVMANYQNEKEVDAPLKADRSFTIECNRPQLHNWEIAALNAGQILSDWIPTALDKAADLDLDDIIAADALLQENTNNDDDLTE